MGVALLVGLGALLAWSRRHVSEDGFFILRMVEILLHSGELAYNPGERYEANTDFLWTLLLIPGPALGVDAVRWMWLASMAVCVMTLLATYALARQLLPSPSRTLVPLALLATHATFLDFAVSGFGIVLLALAGVCALLALRRFAQRADAASGAWLGGALSFMALCRLDAAVLGAPVAACALWLSWKHGRGGAGGVALTPALGIPALVSAMLLAWKLYYYGDILPTTYYVKGAGTVGGINFAGLRLPRGLDGILEYWGKYALWLPVPVALVWRLWAESRRISAPDKEPGRLRLQPALLLTASGMVLCWHVYFVAVGGDNLGFRLLVAQAPQLMLLLGWMLTRLPPRWAWAGAAVMVLAASADYGREQLVAGREWWGEREKRADEVDLERLALAAALKRGEGWHLPQFARPHARVFPLLDEMFSHLGPYPPEVRLAYPAGGEAAYYTRRLLFTEMHGFSDSRISKADPAEVFVKQEPGVYLPGHGILASPMLLARLGANLVLTGSPYILDQLAPPDFDVMPQRYPLSVRSGMSPRLAWARLAADVPMHLLARAVSMPPDSQLFALEVPGGPYWPILYFNRNATIDAILDAHGIERFDVYPSP